MSSEILYDIAFIEVGKQYIPIINQGSSNCYEYNQDGRKVRERYWHVLNLGCRGKILFSRDDIEKTAKYFEAINEDNKGLLRPSRYMEFKTGELERWILSGIKSALTVEEYHDAGNRVLVTDCSREPYKTVYVKTTDQLLEALGNFKGSKEIHVGFLDSRHVYRPFQRKVRPVKEREKFYVLRGIWGYFQRYRGQKVFFTSVLSDRSVRKFSTEKAAQKYLADRVAILGEEQLDIECIERERSA